MSIIRDYWSLPYFRDRAKAKIFEWRNPGTPWLTADAVAFLETWLQTDYRGLEWGSGRSTAWFAARVKHLVSIETDPAWHARVVEKIAQRKLTNVDLVLCPQGTEGYIEAAGRFEDVSLDFVLVDGIRRDECALASIPKIKPGGLLILDDIHIRFPSASRAPLAIPPDGEPSTAHWKRAWELLNGWECQLTTDGVRDTGLWFKPR